MRRQGRLDAHRRPLQGHDGRQRHRRRRAAADLRRGADRQDAEDRRRRDRLRRRRRLQPGHDVRESYNLAKVWNLPAIFVVEDNGYAEITASNWSVGGSQVGRGEGFGMPAMRGRRSGFLRRLRGRARGDRAGARRRRAQPDACQAHRYYGHFEGDAHDLSRRRRGGEAASATNDPLSVFRKRVTEAASAREASRSTRSTGRCKQHIEQCVATAKAARDADRGRSAHRRLQSAY